MKTKHPNAFYYEEIELVWNRSGQLIADLSELGTTLTSLERGIADLTERSKTFVPPQKRDGLQTFDPTADTSDPNEVLAVLKERLRRTAENLNHAADLLGDRRGEVLALAG